MNPPDWVDPCTWLSLAQLTLVDVLHAAPDLLPTILRGAFPTQGKGIRVLRQVSKAVGCLALEAVTTCSVDLGSTARVHQTVLVAKHAKLKELRLTLCGAEGRLLMRDPTQQFSEKHTAATNIMSLPPTLTEPASSELRGR